MPRELPVVAAPTKLVHFTPTSACACGGTRGPGAASACLSASQLDGKLPKDGASPHFSVLSSLAEWQRRGICGSSGHGLDEWVGACILAILWVGSQSGPGQGMAAWYPTACPPPWPVEESRQPIGAPGSAE